MRTILYKYILSLGVIFLGISFDSTGQPNYLITDEVPGGLEYIIYIPDNFDATHEYPVIFYLHGGQGISDGEVGFEDLRHFDFGIPRLIDNKIRNTQFITNTKWNTDDFIVVIPHLPRDPDLDIKVNDHLWDPAAVNDVVEQIISDTRFIADEDRLYFTGISLGAKGVWDYAMAFQDVPTAIVPVSGNGTINCTIAHIPVWAIHGDADLQVDPNQSGEENDQGRSGTYLLVNEYDACTPVYPARLTKLGGLGHTEYVWIPIFDGTGGYDLYQWMLLFDKGGNTLDLLIEDLGKEKTYLMPGSDHTTARMSAAEELIVPLIAEAYDVEGNNITYTWRNVENSPDVEFILREDTDSVSYQFAKIKTRGTYTFEVTASSDLGEASDQVTVEVLDQMPASTGAVIGFDLYTDDNTHVKRLKNNDKVTTTPGEEYNIVARVTDNNSSRLLFGYNQNRKFGLGRNCSVCTTSGEKGYSFGNGTAKAPYWNPEPGQYIITATPYSANPEMSELNPGVSLTYTLFVDMEPPPILPVEFLEVSAKRNGNSVSISWSTATEDGNDFFTIERSPAASDHFEAIGTVDGAGDSQEIRHYRFLDQAPLGGKAYYRIKQTDFDGQSDYSKIVSVNGSEKFEVSLFPNPSEKGNAFLKLATADFYTPVEVQLVDVVGNTYFMESFSPEVLSKEEGYNLSANKISAGLYFIMITQGDQKVQKKLLVK